MHYTDLCAQCQASLKDQFLDGLNNERTWVTFTATASLAMIVRGERKVSLVVNIHPATNLTYYQILDNYKVKDASDDFRDMLRKYVQYVTDYI